LAPFDTTVLSDFDKKHGKTPALCFSVLLNGLLAMHGYAMTGSYFSGSTLYFVLLNGKPVPTFPEAL
jgi:hypothetical protein